jgi:Acyl-CoA synthetases (AMP-forming)/AMP-acid ligases II
MRTGLHDLLVQRATSHPDDPALTYRGVTHSYAHVWRSVRAAAALLKSLGLRRGDRVAVYLEKRPETVTAIFATSAAGGMFVPINHVLKPAQVGHILSDSGARILVTSADRLAQVSATLGSTAVEHVVVVNASASDPPDVSGRYAVHAWSEDAAGAKFLAVPVIDIDPAAILYTSGSTGRPKGVVLSHRNLLVGAESVSGYLGNTSDDVILSILPLSFDAGLSQVTTAFAVGAHCVLMNYLVPRDVVQLCAAHGVTGITCVPPLWVQLATVAWPAEVAARLRYWANTGGRMPRTTLDTLRETFTHADAFLMYGLTEAFRSTFLDPSEVARRPSSIGKAIPNAEILVLRPDRHAVRTRRAG